MKSFCKTSFFFAFLMLSSYGLHAQDTQVQLKPVSLENTEQFSIASKYVAGETYVIQVGLPVSYVPSKKSYPVLYVLDGDKSFGMTKETADWLMWSREIKDIIVVAISYGKGTDEWWQKRARDYSHCDDTIVFKGWFKHTGGADNFLKFVKNELFPMVNNRYRINQDSTAIMGFSFGGLLSSYVLFTQPDTFKGYIIISPALVWNNKNILKMEADYFSQHKELNKLVYMAYGSLDSKDLVLMPTKELVQTLQSRNYSGLKFVSEIHEGETHISGYPVALTHGLKTIFSY